MDINQLLYQHQIALMNAAALEKAGQLRSNFDLVQYYAKRINEYRMKRGLSEDFVKDLADVPASEHATDDEFIPVVAVSMQAALVADLMIAEMLIEKATDNASLPHAPPLPYLGDVIVQLSKLQSDLCSVSAVLSERLAPTGYVAGQAPQAGLSNWENEGGGLADAYQPSTPHSPSFDRFIKLLDEAPTIHDFRARKIRNMINLRNNVEVANDE